MQRKRAKGFRLPPNTICVGRPSRFGNPFRASELGYREAVFRFEVWLKETPEGRAVADAAKTELRGKNLACWCPLNAPACHADVLLELANQ